MEPVTVTIYSDYLCPWCYVASARLYRVQREMGPERVRIDAKAYMLRPEDEPNRRPGPTGSQGRIRAGTMGRADSLKFSAWPEDKTLPVSSIAALAAASAAKLQGEEAFSRYDLALFRAYFERCLDISDREVLLQVAVEEGLDRDHLAREIDSGTHREAVFAEFAECLDLYGPYVSGVPSVIFNGTRSVVGAVPFVVYKTAVQQDLRGPITLGSST